MKRILIGVVIAACGGGSGGGPIPIDELPQQVIDALCGFEVRCGAVSSEAICIAEFEQELNTADVVAGVHDGKITYDANLARQCLDAYNTMSCDATAQSVRVQPQACKDAVKGTVADGGMCEADQVCISELCNAPSCQAACCPGTCDPTPPLPAAIGQSCAGTTCVDGAFCNNSTCAALLAAGASCQSDSQCAYGTMCAGATSPVCAAPPKLGDPCANDSGSTMARCSDVGQFCDATNHCVAKLDTGATCDPTMFGWCKGDLQCDAATMKCDALPAISATCTGSCAPGAFCDLGTTGTCKALEANDTACTSSQECMSNNCDSTSQKCADRPVCT